MIVLALLLGANDVQQTLEHLHAGDEALRAGRYSVAREAFEASLEGAPDRPATLYALACIAAREGDKEEALLGLAAAKSAGFRDRALALWDEDLHSLRGEDAFAAWCDSLPKPPSERSIGAPIGRGLAGKIFAGEPAISEDGTLIAYGDQHGRVHLVEPRSATVTRTIQASERPIWALDLDPRGERLAIVDYGGNLYLYNPRDGEQIAHHGAFDGREDKGWSFGAEVRFGPKGERVFASVAEQGWWLLDRAGRAIGRSKTVEGRFFGPRIWWSEDGRYLVLPEGTTVKLWDVDEGEFARVIEAGEPVTCAALHGQTLLVGHEGTLKGWTLGADVPNWSVPLERELGGHSEGAEARFSPSGKFVAVTVASSCEVFLFDPASGARLWTSGFLGGRMGEPVDVAWQGEDVLWYAWRSGAIRGGRVDVKNMKQVPLEGFGLIPSCAADGSWANAYFGTVQVGGQDGVSRWQGVPLPGGGLLVFTPEGFFSGSIEVEPVRFFVNKETAPLSQSALGRFDPKRVRASLAGVPVHPFDEEL